MGGKGSGIYTRTVENINEHVYDWMLGLPARKKKVF